MYILSILQPVNALVSISLILIGSAWLKRVLRQSVS